VRAAVIGGVSPEEGVHGGRAGGEVKRRHPPSAVLFRRYVREADRAAKEELVLRFLPLAQKLARRYSRSPGSPEDLEQVASLGLVKAIDRFDPDRGSSFPAFATPTILGELKRYFRDSGWAIHVPRHAQERAHAIELAVGELTNRYGRVPTVDQIASHLSLSSEQILDGLEATLAQGALSLQAYGGRSEEEDWSIGDALGAEDERLELVDEAVTVASALRGLPERDQRILRLRFLEELTQREIGLRFGISQMQVSRILRRSIARLRALAGTTG
jgi:RNA polymerase sigma-B factor